MGELEYQVLGSLRVVRSGRVAPLRATKPRRLLATLLLHPNRFVSTDLIADVLWAGCPPRSAIANIRTYVRAVRDALGADGAPPPIETHPAGYSIAVDVDALDATRLERLVTEAARLRRAGDRRGAARAYEEGCRLWRGSPLEDLVLAPAWEGAVTHLERLHRTATDELITLRLATADHAGAVGLVRARLAEDPYDEDLWGHLVRCLLAGGHRHEARSAYDDAVRTLADDLGVEPGESLRTIGALTVEPVPARSSRHLRAAPAGPAASARVVPSQLPLDVPDFTGRDGELRQLLDLFGGSARDRPPVTVISGAPGTGKTALAVHAGHLAKDIFTDGQVYLDMRAAGPPRDPSSALFELLRSLGTANEAIPHDADRRAAALRSELASRRVLVILDDVGSAGQVAPLLPGSGASALIITSRLRLTDLTGAVPVHLDVLGAQPAAELLGRIAGPGRVDPADAAAADIVRACGNLPLAIRIAAGRLVQRPDLTAAALASRLHDERHRLDELSLGELAVRSSADLSYRALGAAEARLYRLAGLLGTGDFPAWAIAPVANGASVERTMDRLIEANLVRITGVDGTGATRYRVHDLLRLHARELAASHHPAQARGDLELVLDGWLRRARLAASRLPYRFFGGQDSSPATDRRWPGPPVEAPRHPDDVFAWFDREQQNVAPMIRAAAAQDLHEHAWRLASAWAPYFDLRGPLDDWSDWRECHEAALASARACGSRRGEAIILRDLGQIALYRDDLATAHRALTTSGELFREVGDLAGVGAAAAGLGTWNREHGRYEEALPWYEEAFDSFVRAGDAHGEAVARNAIAGIWLHRKDFETAAAWLYEAYDLTVRIGDEHREAVVLGRLAELHTMRGDLDAGRPDSAREYLTRALRAWQFVANHQRSEEVRERLRALSSA